MTHHWTQDRHVLLFLFLQSFRRDSCMTNEGSYWGLLSFNFSSPLLSSPLHSLRCYKENLNFHVDIKKNFPQNFRNFLEVGVPLVASRSPYFLFRLRRRSPILDRRKICGFNLSDDSFNQRSGRQIWLTHPSLLEKLLSDFENRAGNASAVTICQV